ncbi:MAG TPA: MCE family protein, partial [Marmoricola sp.]|nr:MCE family protein [Marmoricola sp.]
GEDGMKRAFFALVSVLVLTGCGVSLNDVPLPSVVSGPTYQLTAVFSNALGLPDQADVKLDGAIVGEVEQVKADGYTAQVSMKVQKSVVLPTGTRAEIQFSSPMGEAFVALKPPANATSQSLADGAVIQMNATDAAPSATDLLATLSTVVSGGTFADLSTIVNQLKVALDGNTQNVRSIIANLDGSLQGLNAHTATFQAALDNMNRLSAGLASDRQLLSQAIAGFEPTVRVLRSQTDQALVLMAELRRLSASGQQLIAAGRAHMISVTQKLGPILDTLTRNEAVFPKIFDGIGAFGRASESAGWGLFANFDLTTIFSSKALLGVGK